MTEWVCVTRVIPFKCSSPLILPHAYTTEILSVLGVLDEQTHQPGYVKTGPDENMGGLRSWCDTVGRGQNASRQQDHVAHVKMQSRSYSRYSSLSSNIHPCAFFVCCNAALKRYLHSLLPHTLSKTKKKEVLEHLLPTTRSHGLAALWQKGTLTFTPRRETKNIATGSI